MSETNAGNFPQNSKFDNDIVSRVVDLETGELSFGDLFQYAARRGVRRCDGGAERGAFWRRASTATARSTWACKENHISPFSFAFGS